MAPHRGWRDHGHRWLRAARKTCRRRSGVHLAHRRVCVPLRSADGHSRFQGAHGPKRRCAANRAAGVKMPAPWLWLMFAGTFLGAFVVVEVGYRLARRQKEAQEEAPIGAMVGAVLGLLAFLLAI